MPADSKFFTWAEFTAFVGEHTITRVFDDDTIGQPNDEAVAAIFAETDQSVTSHAVKNYAAKVADDVDASTAHPTLKMLALRYAKAAMMLRAPEVFHGVDVVASMKFATDSLRDLSLGRTHLQDAVQGNAQVVVRNGVTVGGTTCKTFSSFGDF
jgi:hypothetical protein